MKLVKADNISRRWARREITSARSMLDYPFTGEVGEGLADGRRAEAEFGGQAGGHERMPPTEPPRCGVAGQSCTGDREMISLAHYDPPVRMRRRARQPKCGSEIRNGDGR